MYVDGIPIPMGCREPGDVPIDDVVQVEYVEAVEVYQGGASLPLQWGGTQGRPSTASPVVPLDPVPTVPRKPPMDSPDAADFIREAVGPGTGTWADLGAGRGTFTRALAGILGPDGRVLALDRDPGAVAALRRLAEEEPVPGAAPVEALRGDLRELDAVARLADTTLDGALLANVLHFLERPHRPLAWIAERIVRGGRIVVVEYDRRRGNRWVPHPLPPDRLGEVIEAAGLEAPEVTAERPSAYQGRMYCAVVRV